MCEQVEFTVTGEVVHNAGYISHDVAVSGMGVSVRTNGPGKPVSGLCFETHHYKLNKRFDSRR